MFYQLKNINKWRKTQSEIKQQLEQIHVSQERAGYKVTVNANNKVLEVLRDGQEDGILKDLLNESMKEAKKKSEKKLRGQAESLGLGDLI